MSCTCVNGNNVNSTSICCLDFSLVWALNTPTPTLTLTNTSTGETPANLNWWFYITAPSGAIIHGEDLSGLSVLPTPDFSGTVWGPQTFDIPLIFGEAPCGQIEFSPFVPYNVTVYVQDIAVSPIPLFSLLKPSIIVRPTGNQQAGTGLVNSCGNVGAATVNLYVDCTAGNIQVADQTNLYYNGIAPLSAPTNTWTLVAPPPVGTGTPTTTTVHNTPNVTFTPGWDSDGYQLYFLETATYQLAPEITVVIQYTLFDCNGQVGIRFAYNCNINLCNLMCNLQKLYELSTVPCGTLENQNIMNTITRITPLVFQLLIAQSQPGCGVNVPTLISKINKIGKFNDNCGCSGNNQTTTYQP